MPRLEHGEYRALLETVGKYAYALEHGSAGRSKGFFTQGDMSAEEIDALIEKNSQQEHLLVTLDE